MRLGERITSREIAKVDRRLHSIYYTAKKELEDTLADFNKRYAIKDKQKKALVASGKLSMQDYKDWQAGQVFIRKQWQDKLDSVCKIIHTHTQRAAEIVRKGQFEVFAENYNITAMDAERKTGISFNIYNTDAVAELIKEDPQTLPQWKIDEEKDYIWNKRKANNAVIQGIIQGDSIEDITRRLCNKLCTQNENRMRLFARTAMTEAQNSGRQQHMNEAAQKGIKQNKRWLATLDSRTRDVHRHLDGKEVAYNEPFKSDLGEIRYPGDPIANPANVYNCRCSIVTIYPEYEDYSKRDWHEDEIIDGQTYEEWKKGKKKQAEAEQHGGKPQGYKPDKYDEEYKNLDQEKQREREEMNSLYRQINEYNALKKYVSQDVSAYDRFTTEEEYNKYKKSLTDSISDLYAQREELVSKRIRSENFKTEEEYEKAYEEYSTKKNQIREQIQQKETEYFNMKEWAFIEKARKAQKLGIDEINERFSSAMARYTELDKKQFKNNRAQYGIEKAAKRAKDENIEWLTPKKRTEPFNMEQVVGKLSGPDKTKGSCASLAFAYVGQRAGYDVIDYRGGNSRALFSTECVSILRSMKENERSVSTGTAKSYTVAGKRALNFVQEGKEYYFECGKHAAIVRKVGDDLQYLEMQSGYRPNTWYSFSQYGLDETLKWRFASGTKTYGAEVNSYIVDVADMASNERFLKILGYINTEPGKQMKGKGGGEK